MTLASGACNNDNCRIRKCSCMIHQLLRVGTNGRLGKRPALFLNGHFRTVRGIGTVKIEKFLIDLKTCIFHAFLQTDNFIQVVDTARTRTAVNRAGSRPAEQVQFGRSLKRKCTVIILQKYKTFFGNTLSNFFCFLSSFFGNRAVASCQTDQRRQRAKANRICSDKNS